MSVFTTVTPEQLSDWLQAYPLGDLLELQGIASGITNTNYFVTTATGRYVLTLFEKNTSDELPYFLDLMAHLADSGVPCPHPIMRHDGSHLGKLNGKPASLVSCLRGRSIETPSVTQCAEVGRVLAEMHIAGQGFKLKMENPRSYAWRRATANKVMQFLSHEDQELLETELAFELSQDKSGLPHGVIHADMFRDNVLFEGNTLGGIIDFYYACNDLLLYDVAITVNDWCSAEDGSLDKERFLALLKAYHLVRPLTGPEHQAWTGMLRAAAVRFWLSRLYDLHFPQAGELTHAKDPQHFHKILKKRIQQQQLINELWV